MGQYLFIVSMFIGLNIVGYIYFKRNTNKQVDLLNSRNNELTDVLELMSELTELLYDNHLFYGNNEITCVKYLGNDNFQLDYYGLEISHKHLADLIRVHNCTLIKIPRELTAKYNQLTLNPVFVVDIQKQVNELGDWQLKDCVPGVLFRHHFETSHVVWELNLDLDALFKQYFTPNIAITQNDWIDFLATLKSIRQIPKHIAPDKEYFLIDEVLELSSVTELDKNYNKNTYTLYEVLDKKERIELMKAQVSPVPELTITDTTRSILRRVNTIDLIERSELEKLRRQYLRSVSSGGTVL